MPGLPEVFDRLAQDRSFRRALLTDPDAALAGYSLSAADHRALSEPGPHWMELAARVLRHTELPVGPSWDPELAPPSTPPTDGGATTRQDPDPWPDAKVLLHLKPVRGEDGAQAWAVRVSADTEEARGESNDEIQVSVCVEDWGARAHASATVLSQPQHDATPPSVLGTRWGHQHPDLMTDAARAVVAAEPQGRRQALYRYIEQVCAGTDPARTRPVVQPPTLPSGVDAITVVGLGIRGLDQVTREAEHAISEATEVFYIEARPGVRAFLEARCDTVTPLFGETYTGWQGRLSTYQTIAARVLEAALAHPPVVLAVQGHPTVYSYAPTLLRDASPALGLRTIIQPGISAESALFAHLGLDPCDHGIQSFEATDVLLRRRALTPDVATLIWQAHTVESRLHNARPNRESRFTRLIDWLRRYYPTDHPVAAIHISTVPGMNSTVNVTELDTLAATLARMSNAITLYIPPVGRRHLADPVLARWVDDPAHLARLTE